MKIDHRGVLERVEDVDIKNGKFEIPQNVVAIGDFAFAKCSSLSEVIIPNNVKSIGTSAFCECDNLSSITISEGVTSIGDTVFYRCGSLANVIIPDSVTSIGDGAFYECSSLASIKIPEGVKNIGNSTFYKCNSLSDVKIPDSVISIDNSAFAECRKLKNITIPKNVTNISSAVFKECSNLSKVDILGNIDSIGINTFYECSNLIEITIPKSVKSIGSFAFKRCSSLSNVKIPEGVTEIGSSAFSKCNSLTRVEIPKSVRYINMFAFADCTELANVKIPEGLVSIGSCAFSGCSKLEEITIPEGVTRIADYTFSECSSLWKVTLPKSVKSIYERAFSECSSLSDVTIPPDITSIEEGTFMNCTSLSKIMIPEKVIRIEDNAFYGCNNLLKVTIPDDITGIGHNAFYQCSNLIDVTIPESLTSIEGDAFTGCTNLEKINVKKGKEPEDYKYSSVDGVLYILSLDENQKALVRYPEGKKDISSYVIPDGTIELQKAALEGCNHLKKVSIPKDLMHYETGVGYDYNNVDYDKSTETTILENKRVAQSNKYIPEPYLSYLLETKKIEDFISNSDFRAFNSNIPNLKEMLSGYSEEEQLDFFKFAVCLGCFSNEKFLDKNSKEMESTVGEKASTLLAKLMGTPQLKLGEYHGLFDSLSFSGKAPQEFLEFITPQGTKNNNLELLIELEYDYPGMFSKVMQGFNEAKKRRITLNEDGTLKEISWEDVLKDFYSDSKYNGITEECEDIAEVYSSKGLKQDIFDEAVNLRKEAQSTNIPEHILGKPIKELSILKRIEQIKQQTEDELKDSQKLIDDLYSKKFTYEWLSKNNPKNGIIGLYTSCCANIASQFYGKNIARASITKKEVQNLVVRDAKGEIIAKGVFYINEKYKYGVFNDFELNQKYREHEDRSNRYGGRYVGDDKDESELSKSERNQRKDRDLIFSALQRGISAFVEEYDKQHPNEPLQQINVGMGYNRLKRNVEQFEKATKLLTIPAEYGFNDALDEQYILYKRKEKEKDDRSL